VVVILPVQKKTLPTPTPLSLLHNAREGREGFASSLFFKNSKNVSLLRRRRKEDSRSLAFELPLALALVGLRLWACSSTLLLRASRRRKKKMKKS